MSRQNSREISSLDVTLNGSQVSIDPVQNETKPFDDVKVLLLKGEKGDRGADPVQADYAQGNPTALDYIKNKPTLGTAASKNVPTSGNASASQVVMGNDTRLTNSRVTEHSLYIGSAYGSDQFDGSAEKKMQGFNALLTVSADGWSANPDADGYYTQDVYLMVGSYMLSMDSDLPFNVSLAGTPTYGVTNPRPTAAEAAAYNLIDPTYYVPDSNSADYIRFFTKTIPSSDFTIKVQGFKTH